MKGKVVLVTGASSGLGKAAALAFAQAGAQVMLGARRREESEAVVEAIRTQGGTAAFEPLDVTEPASVARWMARTVEQYGRIDAAFNNAGTEGRSFLATADISEADFQAIVDVNLTGVWRCMQQELRQMATQQPAGGAIVNTASINGLGGARMGAAYSASKAGVIALTKSAAQEYAMKGIRVNALVAGVFRTPMLERIFLHQAGGDPDAVAGVEQKYARMIPKGRIGRAREAAEVVVWLCSDAASYVTGHSMIVDGGMTAAVR